MPDETPTKPTRARPSAPTIAALTAPAENPIAIARKGLGLTRREFAMAIGRSYPLLTALEATNLASLSETLRPSFTAMGLDFDALAAEYVAHRAAHAAACVRKAVAHG